MTSQLLLCLGSCMFTFAPLHLPEHAHVRAHMRTPVHTHAYAHDPCFFPWASHVWPLVGRHSYSCLVVKREMLLPILPSQWSSRNCPGQAKGGSFAHYIHGYLQARWPTSQLPSSKVAHQGLNHPCSPSRSTSDPDPVHNLKQPRKSQASRRPSARWGTSHCMLQIGPLKSPLEENWILAEQREDRSQNLWLFSWG